MGIYKKKISTTISDVLDMYACYDNVYDVPNARQSTQHKTVHYQFDNGALIFPCRGSGWRLLDTCKGVDVLFWLCCNCFIWTYSKKERSMALGMDGA